MSPRDTDHRTCSLTPPQHAEMHSITVSSSWIRFCRVSRSASPPHVHAHGDAGLADCTAVLLPHSACIISCRLDVAPSLRHARGSSCAIASSSSCAGRPVPGVASTRRPSSILQRVVSRDPSRFLGGLSDQNVCCKRECWCQRCSFSFKRTLERHCFMVCMA